MIETAERKAIFSVGVRGHMKRGGDVEVVEADEKMAFLCAGLTTATSFPYSYGPVSQRKRL